MDALVLRQLKDLGVADISHVNGSFLQHLQGVGALLQDWGNREALCHAGLFHSIYGSAGFQQAAVSLNARDRVAEIIGTEAERIVYTFCACERPEFHLRLKTEANPEYRDRFTGDSRHLEPALLRDYCELTVADKLDIFAGRSHENSREDDERIRSLLLALHPHISAQAQAAFRHAFASIGLSCGLD